MRKTRAIDDGEEFNNRRIERCKGVPQTTKINDCS